MLLLMNEVLKQISNDDRRPPRQRGRWKRRYHYTIIRLSRLGLMLIATGCRRGQTSTKLHKNCAKLHKASAINQCFFRLGGHTERSSKPPNVALQGSKVAGCSPPSLQGCENRGARDRWARDRGATDRGARDRGARDQGVSLQPYKVAN